MKLFSRPTAGLGLAILLAIFQTTVAAPPVPVEKRVLYIRIDFPDLKGDPVPFVELQKTLSQVHAYYFQNSYGKFSLKFTVVTTRRMPHTAAFYETNRDDQQIIRDARAAAKAIGYDTEKFEYDIVAFKTRGGGDSGLSAIGGKGQRLLNNFRTGVHIHEFGHNLGLPHANLWVTHDDTVTGPGNSLDYGDIYDPMGGGGDASVMQKHLSIRSKALLGWLGDGGIKPVTESGIYRIYAQDNPGSPGSKGLLIKRNADESYWVEFRQQITNNALVMNGARLLRSYQSMNQLDLMDMTPGSPGASGDASLLLGKWYDDDEAQIHILPIAKGGTQPESLDVLVNMGPRSANNRSPELRLTASVQKIPGGQMVEFKATASDPDGDVLHYIWDFGDGTFDWGKPVVTHRWPATADRDFLVRCVVTDEAGGTTQKSHLIRVTNSSTRNLYGSVSANGQPLANVLVQANPATTALTDSDGTFALIGVKPGKYRVSAKKAGYVFQGINADTSRTEPIHVTSVSAKPDAIEIASGIELQGRERVETPGYFKPPVEFTIVAKTDSNDLRFAYAADALIFNWRAEPGSLRMEGGVAGGKHKPGAGSLPANQYVTIRWRVTPKSQAIYVDGALRYEHAGDYSMLNRPLAVFTDGAAKVTVKSVKAKQLLSEK
jgi:hypothetical protein